MDLLYFFSGSCAIINALGGSCKGSLPQGFFNLLFASIIQVVLYYLAVISLANFISIERTGNYAK
jgi:hypothetical protein